MVVKAYLLKEIYRCMYEYIYIYIYNNNNNNYNNTNKLLVDF